MDLVCTPRNSRSTLTCNFQNNCYMWYTYTWYKVRGKSSRKKVPWKTNLEWKVPEKKVQSSFFQGTFFFWGLYPGFLRFRVKKRPRKKIPLKKNPRKISPLEKNSPVKRTFFPGDIFSEIFYFLSFYFLFSVFLSFYFFGDFFPRGPFFRYSCDKHPHRHFMNPAKTFLEKKVPEKWFPVKKKFPEKRSPDKSSSEKRPQIKSAREKNPRKISPLEKRSPVKRSSLFSSGLFFRNFLFSVILFFIFRFFIFYFLFFENFFPGFMW